MVIERRAVRALLLRDRREILLLRVRGPEGTHVWIAPGGAPDPLPPEEVLFD